MGSSTEEQWAAPSWIPASDGQLSTQGKQGSSFAPAAKVHRAPGETSPVCVAALPCESQSHWELQGRVVYQCSRQVSSREVAQVHFLLLVCNWPRGQGKSKDTKQKHWEEVVESFNQRCCRALDRTLVKLCSQVLTGSRATEFWLNSGCQHQGLH